MFRELLGPNYRRQPGGRATRAENGIGTRIFLAPTREERTIEAWFALAALVVEPGTRRRRSARPGQRARRNSVLEGDR